MKRVLLWLALALSLTSATGIASSAPAQPGTVVRIQPAEGTYRPGETFAVDVRIEDVVDLYGVDVHVAFDSARLEVTETRVTPGSDLLSPPWLVLYNQVENRTGSIWYVVTLLNPHPPVSGSGTLFTFHFRALAAGQAAADISEPTLSDINGDLIPATTASAIYRVAHAVFLPLVFQESLGGRQVGDTARGSSWRDVQEDDRR